MFSNFSLMLSHHCSKNKYLQTPKKKKKKSSRTYTFLPPVPELQRFTSQFYESVFLETLRQWAGAARLDSHRIQADVFLCSVSNELQQPRPWMQDLFSLSPMNQLGTLLGRQCNSDFQPQLYQPLWGSL